MNPANERADTLQHSVDNPVSAANERVDTLHGGRAGAVAVSEDSRESGMVVAASAASERLDPRLSGPAGDMSEGADTLQHSAGTPASERDDSREGGPLGTATAGSDNPRGAATQSADTLQPTASNSGDSHPLLWEGDVVVVGGGSAGCAAAVAAARTGARTLLIESAGFLGGTGAAVLDTFYGFYAPGGEGERVVGGIAWEVAAALLDTNQAFERPNSYGAGTGVTYEPEALKLTWDRLTQAAAVDTLLHATVIGVTTGTTGTTSKTTRRITALTVLTKAGTRTVTAKAIVDASGDAEIAWRAGAALERPANDQKRQPLTATFRLGGVNTDVINTKDLHERLAKAAESGNYRLPRREGSVHRTVLPGVVHTNLTRVNGLDPTDPWQLSAAEAEGRAQVAEYVRFLTEEVPGYEDAYLLSTSVRIGVRETRRLIGRYVLTREDVLEANDFPDAVARCGAPVEDHDGGESTIWEYVGGHRSGRTYGVPYRCLLPTELDNLAVAGRCLSATHDAHASVRSMAQCMALGQAAGTAAALAGGGAVGDLDATVLRDRLAGDAAVL